MNPDPKALLRTELIVKVRAGLMTATAAAETLGCPASRCFLKTGLKFVTV
jgi:hypothetical protein